MSKKMTKTRRDYFLGFDIGTDSVGWAVTDTDYNVMKFNGQAMWGSRLFDAAQTAVDRRLKRCNRRRLKRRSWRIGLLQELFAEEIFKVDPGFFQRMKESALYEEDKNISQQNSLFSECTFTDKDYYEQYPTIYHLRKDLIESREKKDLRLIYLALHHIVKHRGHFLVPGSISDAVSFQVTFQNFKQIIFDEFELEINPTEDELAELEETLKNKRISKRDKEVKVKKLLAWENNENKKQVSAIAGVICGGKKKITELFNDETLDDGEVTSISFAEGNYEEVRDKLEDELQERAGVLDYFKAVYDWTILADLLKGGETEEGSYLSIAKVSSFEKHKEDLKKLKMLFANYSRDAYRDFFQKEGKTNYCAYIGSTRQKGKKIAVKRCTKDDFYKEINKMLKQFKEEQLNLELISEIENEIAEGVFLPLQISKDNGVIPYQIHQQELSKILKNASSHYPFLNEKDEKNLSVIDKVNELFQFRIPYYVGPLNTHVGKNSWMVRKEEGRILPWNLEEKVDTDQSAEKFIRRMTNKCTYLVGKDVLPKNSLLYSEYMVLNELNNVKVKDEKLSVEIKQKAFSMLFQKKKKVTGNMLLKFLISEGYEDMTKEDLSGFDQNFNTSLLSYLEFKKIFLEDIEKYSVKNMIEDLILWITLYSEDKKMLKRVIRNHYGIEVISEEQLKKVLKIKLQGWGNFSKEFLTECEGACIETGEIFSVISGLRETNENLMQLLSGKYTFVDQIQEANQKEMKVIHSITYENVMEERIGSPAIKRSAWQVVLLTEEIRKIMGKAPKKIFVEMARGNLEKQGRTTSRKEQFLALYQSIKGESRDWCEEIKSKEDSDFRNIKLYLYYTQMGRCMYSGRPIDLSQLMDTNVYDRDHIYPQSKTKDDSLDNLVLVEKKLNADKSNYGISAETRKERIGFWNSLLSKKLISKEKYKRLTRTTPLSEEELAGFINRQLVETRQSSKIVTEIFQELYPQSPVVYVKAKSISDFRRDQLKVVKVRSVNDYHHAQDAYLNIVVGNVYNEKFTSNPLHWIKKNPKTEYSLSRMFDWDLIKEESVVWKKGNEGSIATVRKNYQLRDCQYTRYAITNKGELFNQQLVKKTENAAVEIKQGMDVNKYGGYKSLNPAYFVLVESKDKKGKLMKTIESIPIYLAEKLEKDEVLMNQFLREKYDLLETKLLVRKIKKDTLFEINGFFMHLRGSTGRQLIFQGAVQLRLEENTQGYIKKIEKYIQRNIDRRDKRTLLAITEYDGITKEKNIELFDVFTRKHKDTIYKNRPGSQIKTLTEGKDKFIECSLEEQVIVLNEILHLFQCKPITSDLSSIGGAKRAGILNINKDQMSVKASKIIYTSVTGLLKNEFVLKEGEG